MSEEISANVEEATVPGGALTLRVHPQITRMSRSKLVAVWSFLRVRDAS